MDGKIKKTNKDVEMKGALIVWCEYSHHRKTLSIPTRISAYLKADLPVFYAPSDTTKIPPNFPLSNIELILSGEDGMQDSYVQERLIVRRLKEKGIKSVELCGPIADLCLSDLKVSLELEGIGTEINKQYSTTLAEHL